MTAIGCASRRKPRNRKLELLVHHGVVGDGVVELRHLLWRRQLAVEQQIADLQEARMLGQLVDRIAAIEQNALVAVDEGDVAFAGGGRGEAGIVGEEVGLAVELADVDDIGALGARIAPAARCRLLPIGEASPIPLVWLGFALWSLQNSVDYGAVLRNGPHRLELYRFRSQRCVYAAALI